VSASLHPSTIPAPDGTSRTLVATENLSKYFPVRKGLFGRPTKVLRAVEDVSLRIRRGETLGLVGESGCGKSTLGRCILRLVEPSYGRVVYDGRDLLPLSQSELRAYRRRMQIIFQDPYSSLNPRMTVREIVGEALDIHGLAKNAKEADDRVAELLRWGVELKRYRPPTGDKSCMHVKSWVCDGEVLIGGSANFTRSGIQNNVEHLIITKDAESITLYLEWFEQIWLEASSIADGRSFVG
jgi:ABC-type glutathione transport system ATPase component